MTHIFSDKVNDLDHLLFLVYSRFWQVDMKSRFEVFLLIVYWYLIYLLPKENVNIHTNFYSNFSYKMFITKNINSCKYIKLFFWLNSNFKIPISLNFFLQKTKSKRLLNKLEIHMFDIILWQWVGPRLSRSMKNIFKIITKYCYNSVYLTTILNVLILLIYRRLPWEKFDVGRRRIGV